MCSEPGIKLVFLPCRAGCLMCAPANSKTLVSSWTKRSKKSGVFTTLNHLPKNKHNMKRNATAVWQGSGKEGQGHLTTQSTVLNKSQYSFNTRFADGIGTNPEELVAAAHAGCFTMKLSFVLGAAGFTPASLKVTCGITLDSGKITESKLQLI